MKAPLLSIGDGALGFWAAVRIRFRSQVSQGRHFADRPSIGSTSRTANPIESAFATVRLRQRVTKGAGSRAKALLMAFKLLDMASQRWRRINASGLVARLILGEKFVDGLNEEARNAA